MSEQSVADKRNDLRQLKEKDFCCRTIHTPRPAGGPAADTAALPQGCSLEIPGLEQKREMLALPCSEWEGENMLDHHFILRECGKTTARSENNYWNKETQSHDRYYGLVDRLGQ